MRKFGIGNVVILLFLIGFLAGCSRAKTVDLHPVLTTDVWKHRETEQDPVIDPDGTVIFWHTADFYEHPNGKWLLGEHRAFGELVIKAYGVRDENDILKAHWISFHNGRKWDTVGPEIGYTINWKTQSDDSGRIVSVTTILYDGSGEEIMRREIKRVP